MQNRLPNFAAYANLSEYLKKTPLRDMYRGVWLHLPRNFLVALQGMKLTDQISYYTYFGQAFVSQSLAYPLLTI
jgi:hypothetical protein